MILNTGSRTDIPAYYSDWFYNRLEEGYVCVRNPYYPSQVTKYILAPELIDVMVFCTKNPQPMFKRFSRLADFETFWFMTITPYEKEIEPYVPPVEQATASFQHLSELVGKERMSWLTYFLRLRKQMIYRYTCAVRMRNLRGSMWMRTDACRKPCWNVPLAAS